MISTQQSAGTALMVRGYRVEHIIGPKGRRAHSMTACAVVEHEQILYPALPVEDPDA